MLVNSLLDVLLPGTPSFLKAEVSEEIEASKNVLNKTTPDTLNFAAAKASMVLVFNASVVQDKVLELCNVETLLSTLPFIKASPRASLELVKRNDFEKPLEVVFVDMTSTTINVQWNNYKGLLDSEGVEGTTEWSLGFLKAAMNLQVQSIPVTFADGSSMAGFMKGAVEIIDGLQHDDKTYVFQTSNYPENSVHFNLIAKQDVDLFYWN